MDLEDVVKYLKDLVEDQNTEQDIPGTSSIHIAASEGDITTLESVMSALDEFNINIQDGLGQTPLMIACKNGHKEVVKLLLSSPNLDINMEDDEDLSKTALLIACYNGYEAIVEMLLSHEYIQVNKAGGFSRFLIQTPLEMACNKGHQGVVRLLLARDDIDTYTALMTCCESGNLEYLRILLDHEEKDINLTQGSSFPDSFQYEKTQTPLMIASQKGQQEVVQLLLGYPNLDVNMADNGGNTALLMACENGYEAIVEMLLGHDLIQVNKANDFLDTPLMKACQEPLWEEDHESYLEIVRVLLTREDVNVNAQNEDKSTALIMACDSRNTEVISMLLKRDEIQMSDQNIEAVVDFVMKRQMDIKDKRDMNAVIDEAVFKNLLDIARWLIKTQGYLSRAYTDMAGLCRSKRRSKRKMI